MKSQKAYTHPNDTAAEDKESNENRSADPKPANDLISARDGFGSSRSAEDHVCSGGDESCRHCRYD